MKVFIQQEFKEVQKAIADEEEKALHLVDIQEAMATAHVAEILADVQSHMERLMTQMAQAKEQLDTSNESAEPKEEVMKTDPDGERKTWTTNHSHFANELKKLNYLLKTTQLVS
ncbi:tripartite motif-containing protein 44-like isoform X1 [Talpa occidentalis]|uniref:tripartite motif-containing protein 44-like isoform X1 n=1 Tax=Talpa occidentalis TaxID=50954 RepID=UPI00188F70AD|nr:tripartite motif-containing protein 44-like isoform X1 [Talpa occidentalis]